MANQVEPTVWDLVQKYIRLGFVCLPTEQGGKKNPALGEWKKYQEEKPTQREYELWFKNKNIGVGTLCGKISGLTMIDLDSYKAHAKIINLDTPVKVRTGGGGLHGYFRYKEGQGNRATKDAIDIKSEGGFAVLPPTIHKSGNSYKWEIKPGLNLEEAMEQLPEISGELLEWMQNNKLDGSQPENNYMVSESVGVNEGERNDKLYRFACSVLARHYNPEEALEMIAQVNQTYNPPLTDSEVFTLFQSAQTFIALQEKPTKKEKLKKEKDNVIYTSFLETPEFILEQIKVTTDTTHTTYTTYTKYIKYDKITAQTSEEDNILYQGKQYEPITDELLDKGIILLPSGIEEYGDEKTLTKRIRNFLFTYFELPPFFEMFLPYLALFYWVYDEFPFVPYLHFVGLTGTGKTTAQEVFGSICYKPIDASGAITLSPIFRTAATWHGTLLLDEFEPNGEGYDEMLAFLKSGVGNKAVLRTEGDSKREVRAYLIKSPKIFTSENPISNAGLQSRTLMVQMQKNKRKIPLYRLGAFLDEAEHLRNQLLLWRLRNLNKINLKDIEFGFPELQGFDRRVQQVITPIYYLSDEETKAQITDFAEIQERETKRERLESLEGQIFQVIFDNYPNGTTLASIHKEINTDRGGRREITEKKIGNVVRKILNFEIERLGDQNIRTVMVEGKEPRIKELSEYFGLPPVSVGKVVSVVPVVNKEDQVRADSLFEEYGE